VNHTPLDATACRIDTPAFGGGGFTYRYDVSADGQRFLIVPPQMASSDGVTVIQNWAAGLQK